MNGEVVHEAVGANIFVNVYDAVSVYYTTCFSVFYTMYFIKENRP